MKLRRANFLTIGSWKRLRFSRVSYYLWRRQWQPRLQRASLRGIEMGRQAFTPRDRWGQWVRDNRRILISLSLFTAAIGVILWGDILRLSLYPGANALNPAPSLSSTPSPPPSPASTPLQSIDRFQQFATPSLPRSSTPVPDKLPLATPKTTNASQAKSSPLPTNSPPASTPVPPPQGTRSVPPTVPSTPVPSVSPPRPQPPYEVSWAPPSNYGDRFAKDIYGNVLTQEPIIVLHETVYSADSAVNYFQTPHSNEDDQASYHSLIRLNGTIIYIVPPDKRAFGAGNSVFVGKNGEESAKTHTQYAPSVNNFAYHISLETPIDGENDNENHSGYTEAQYRSLAWLVAQSTVPDDRITTHRIIDRSSSRIDPRSFDFKRFFALLHQQRSPL